MAVIESGLQLMSRLITRRCIDGLLPEVFGDQGILPGDFIEISGDAACGKTLLMTELITKCILPETYEQIKVGGKSVRVLLIDCDHHFSLVLLSLFLESHLKNINLDKRIIKTLVKESLQRLSIVQVYSLTELYAAIDNLSSSINEVDGGISLICIDSLSAYYWSERIYTGKIISMDSFKKKILSRLKSGVIFSNKINVLYTIPTYFFLKLDQNSNSLLAASYKIRLSKNVLDKNTFVAQIDAKGQTNTKIFKITPKIEWSS